MRRPLGDSPDFSIGKPIPLAIEKPDGVLSVLPHTREDICDRGKSVLGFWDWTDSRSSRSRGTRTARILGCGFASSDGASGLRVLRLSAADLARARSSGANLGR